MTISTASPSRYGCSDCSTREAPAKPAAIRNVPIGRQQLEAATTLPIAATGETSGFQVTILVYSRFLMGFISVQTDLPA